MALISKLEALGDLVREKTGKLTREELVSTDVFKVENLEGMLSAHYIFPAGVRSAKIKRINASSASSITYAIKDSAEVNGEIITSLDLKNNEEVLAENLLDGYVFTVINVLSDNPLFNGEFEITSYDSNGDAIEFVKIVKNTMTLEEMRTELSNVEVGSDPIIEELNITENGTYTAPEGVDGYSPVIVNVETGGGGEALPEEAFNITGACTYRFAYDGWNWFINEYGNKIKTSDISNVNYLFSQSDNLESIPFNINISKSCGANPMDSIFHNCKKLKELPLIKGELDAPTSNYTKNPTMDALFQGCFLVREIPYDYFDNFGGEAFWTAAQQYSGDRNAIFNNCYSLRALPNISNLAHKPTSPYNALYYNICTYCNSLDEIADLPVLQGTLTSNAFYSSFSYCGRLNKITFETNEDGTPQTANWKSQVISLGKADYVGYVRYASYITDYNSGITEDKEVKDDATYQALKNDEDWFTTNIAYSRYNHDSAVATINSLPDTSAYLATAGGTNTIKFLGASGELTDGGAINTLTEEEIAVATAKGWTVSLA